MSLSRRNVKCEGLFHWAGAVAFLPGSTSALPELGRKPRREFRLRCGPRKLQGAANRAPGAWESSVAGCPSGRGGQARREGGEAAFGGELTAGADSHLSGPRQGGGNGEGRLRQSKAEGVARTSLAHG